MDNSPNHLYPCLKLARVPVDKIVDKRLISVDGLWINPLLIHSPNLSTKLSTELSTDSTPLIHRFIHSMYSIMKILRPRIRVSE